MKKKIALFGGTGGLGNQVADLLSIDYDVYPLGSKDVDVTNYAQVEEWFSENKITNVINLSGYSYDSFAHKYTEGSHSEIEKQIDINVKGSVNIVNACLGHMRQEGYGRIILTSSILATTPALGTSIYSGCKGFLDSFAKGVAIENAAKGITCNTIQLGYFDGGMTHRIPDNIKESFKASIPTKRWGTIKELCSTLVFLLENGYVNGQSIRVSGGL